MLRGRVRNGSAFFVVSKMVNHLESGKIRYDVIELVNLLLLKLLIYTVERPRREAGRQRNRPRLQQERSPS